MMPSGKKNHLQLGRGDLPQNKKKENRHFIQQQDRQQLKKVIWPDMGRRNKGNCQRGGDPGPKKSEISPDAEHHPVRSSKNWKVFLGKTAR